MDPKVPFFVSGLGCLADYVSTRIGLSLGFYETHVYYHPLLALAIFWGALTVLHVAGASRKGALFIASWAFLGAVNNALVILGVFGGLVL